MKLLNQSITLISLSLLVIIGIWGTIFYYNQIGEIKQGVDESLDNYRRQIVYQAHQDTVLLKRIDFNEGFYSIREISKEDASKVLDKYLDTIIQVHKGVDYYEEEPFRMLITAFEDDGHFYKLRVINSMVEKDDLINQTFKDLVILYILLMICIFIINNLVLRQVWRPFYLLLERLKKYHIGRDDSVPKISTKTTEFQDLQEVIQAVLQRNKLIYEQQKEFIGNAAHELQTPLAITLNKLELLVEKEGLNDEDLKIIGETMNIIQRLIRLNRSLLLLTKIENRQFLDSDEISLNEIVKKTIKDLNEMVDYKNQEIELIENGNFKINMNPALAEILVNNLLRNAVFHSPEGTIEIIISSSSLKIGNLGNESLDEQVIFHRFHKSSSKSNGSGLGLSIAKAICDLYYLKISYSYADGKHWFVMRG